MGHLITISGQPGTGTTSIATALKDELDAEYVNAGSIFRALAEEHDMTLDEFSKHVNKNPDIDREIDYQLRQAVEEFLDTSSEPHSTSDQHEDLQISIDVDTDAEYMILESRLAGWIAGSDATFRIWCQAPLSIRCDRIDDSTDREEHADALLERQNDEEMRYKQWYDIDITDTTIYDLVINTSRWSPEAVTRIIGTTISDYNSTADEGATPTDAPFFESQEQ